jgi:hypothetical protein
MKTRALLGALGLALSACGGGSNGGGSTPAPGTGSGFTYQAITHVSWWHDEYTSSEGQASRAELASTGANWAGLIVTWYMGGPDSVSIAPDPQRTPTDAALIGAITDLHARGLRVMLKPHVDVQDGSWRGTIAPRDPGAWFASYSAFLGHYAALAESQGVEMLAIGTELATMSGAAYEPRWASIISETRSAFRGTLTYAANAVTAGDEFTSVSFWGQVDVVGLDAYAPLSDAATPTVAELVQGWTQNPNGEDIEAAFSNLQRSVGKPVMFTELGYRSVQGAASRPWDFSLNGPSDTSVQANAYEAAFEVWSKETAWFQGIFWWDWAVPVPATGDEDYTPRDKPAEAVLQRWQHP